jgi:branched-chain amino acid transport system ATP-binding protein
MALKVADDAAGLEVGRLALSGPAAELAASEDVQRLYLGGHAESQAQADAEREEAQAHRSRRELSRWTG